MKDPARSVPSAPSQITGSATKYSEAMIAEA